ncbi:acyl-CoA dehydrogenase family protein [Arthrobacter ginkgonis]|uniref:Acyl-CoA dehydrogenase family protein n=1 Tax=Arthrobacter ginkgonis TaxID=1630594 RepID=A0ABP7CE89_9MICC
MSTLSSVSVQHQISQVADRLRDSAGEAELAGRLAPEVADLVKGTGVVRMLQSCDNGGLETSLEEFSAAVMQIAALNPAAGWVAGVVGVHPWELSQADPRLQAELWGTDPDTWIASPYAPTGRAVPVDGGYRLTGRWQFSSGTDNCQWVVIGGVATDAEGNAGEVPDVRHFVLPRADYRIVEDSWNVIGLKGTGSKDLVVTDAFVPEHRAIGAAALIGGGLTERNRPGHPLYAMPFGVVFSYAIASATLGITQGALREFTDYTRNRIGAMGDRVAGNPFQQAALAEASADIRASRLQLLDGARRMQEIAATGRRLTESERLEFRTDQVRASRRAVDAVDRLFTFAGGGSLRLEQPFQRYWRDAHAAMNHVCNIAEAIYQGYGQDTFGLEHDRSIFY